MNLDYFIRKAIESDFYEALPNCGAVVDTSDNHWLRIRPRLDDDGDNIYWIKLAYGGMVREVDLRRAIWIAKYGSIPKDKKVRNKDGNFSNNRWDNLELI